MKNLQLLLTHLVVSMNRYEKILLKKKLLTPEDIRYTRELIKEEMSEKEFARLKEMVVVLDPDYSGLFAALIGESFNKEEEEDLKEVLKEAIYYKHPGTLIKFLKRVEEKNIKEYSPNNPLDWIQDKYGKDLFTE